MNYLSLAMAVVCSIGVALTLGGTLLTLHFFRVKKEAPLFRHAPGISVLKPLKGVDADTAANLESFFHQDYSEFELLFSVESRLDPVIPLVRGLIQRFPAVKASLTIGAPEQGLNPKINNLCLPYTTARFDQLLISDSNVVVQPDYLSKLASEFPAFDMICSVIGGAGPRNFTGLLEEVFLGTFYARPNVTTLYLGHPYMTGKSLLFRRSAMEKLGGIRSLADYLAEDLVMGERFREAGLRVGLSRHPVTQCIGAPTFRSFWARHKRWGRIRRAHEPLTFLFEPLCANAFVFAALGTGAAAPWLKVSPLLTYTFLLGAWMVCDLVTLRAVGSKLSARTVGLWALRELLHLPLWVHTACGNSVHWRGGDWRIQNDGKLVPPTSYSWNQQVPRRKSLSLRSNESISS